MARHRHFVPHGVIPASLLPFDDDLAVDQPSYRAHLRDLGATEGISSLAINAHASEVASCSFDEQRRILEISQEEVGDRLPLVHGVYADGTLEAVRIAKMAHAGGASALLVFPPNPFTLGHTKAMVIEHYRRIADVTDLPLIVFQYPLASGQGHSLDTLVELAELVPTVRAIKDWSSNPQVHEQQVRKLQSLARPVNVLSTHSAWLMSSLALRCDGLLSGSGSVIADLQVQIYLAMCRGDLVSARRVADRIFPIVSVFYSDPWVDMHNRMKEALVMLGRLPRAVVRPPLVRIGSEEREQIRRALVEAGLLLEANNRSAA